MRKPRILVVDDNVTLRAKLVRILKGPYAVRTATDGRHALNICQSKPPDLLVTDVLMPHMNGWELVRALRAQADLALLPVIFLTTESSATDLLNGFRLGADDFLSKPVSGKDLLARVEQVLRKRDLLVESVRDRDRESLQGSLRQVGLSVLLSLISDRGQTGVIRLERSWAEDSETAAISVRNGQVIQAKLDSQPGLQSRDVALYLLSWSTGRFRFRQEDVTFDDEVQLSTNSLLMEGARQIDEISARWGEGTDHLRRQFTSRIKRAS